MSLRIIVIYVVHVLAIINAHDAMFEDGITDPPKEEESTTKAPKFPLDSGPRFLWSRTYFWIGSTVPSLMDDTVKTRFIIDSTL